MTAPTAPALNASSALACTAHPISLSASVTPSSSFTTRIWTPNTLLQMPSTPTDASAARIGGLRWSDADHHVFMFRRLICVMMVTAFRLGEVVRHHSKLTTLLQRGLQNPQWLVSYRTPCLTLTEPPADPFCRPLLTNLPTLLPTPPRICRPICRPLLTNLPTPLPTPSN